MHKAGAVERINVFTVLLVKSDTEMAQRDCTCLDRTIFKPALARKRRWIAAVRV
jgi:hypothetical protein